MDYHLLTWKIIDGIYNKKDLYEKSYEAQARMENLDELLGIKQFEQTEEKPSLLTFLESTLDTTTDEEEDQRESLWWQFTQRLEPLSFVVGAEESVFPSFQSINDGEDSIEEERRLFYVAMTRAMKRYILFAQARMLWGSIKYIDQVDL